MSGPSAVVTMSTAQVLSRRPCPRRRHDADVDAAGERAAVHHRADGCQVLVEGHPQPHGAEAVLLHAAAHLDVAGYRARDLPPAYARAVVAELPRDGFPGEFGELMRRESVVRPRSTAAALWLSGVRIPLRLNPLNRLGRR